MRDQILGVLYGMAIGDAMGMPPELWSRNRLLKEYGEITDFLEGNPQNCISHQYKRGEFTDDTSQAIAILDSLIETHFCPSSENIAAHILRWAEKEHAFENNMLGPTSKIVLEMLERGEEVKSFSDQAVTNGAAMRIPPIGTLFYSEQKEALCSYAAAVSRVTHSSDITVAGASMTAMAVASVMDHRDRRKMIEDVLAVEEYALSLGAETVSASLGARIQQGVWLADKYQGRDQEFLKELYRNLGAGVNAIESVPCAVSLAYYSFDVKKCALLCANLGGDTDTIGAMACAICGGNTGAAGIAEGDIRLIQEVNGVDFDFYAEAIEKKRGKLI